MRHVKRDFSDSIASCKAQEFLEKMDGRKKVTRYRLTIYIKGTRRNISPVIRALSEIARKITSI